MILNDLLQDDLENITAEDLSPFRDSGQFNEAVQGIETFVRSRGFSLFKMVMEKVAQDRMNEVLTKSDSSPQGMLTREVDKTIINCLRAIIGGGRQDLGLSIVIQMLQDDIQKIDPQ
jgi:hypothetical protein